MGKAWVKARKRDPYYRAAKAQDLRSRAAFKLVQIQERFGLIYPGDVIVDLGASPGGWSRAAAEMVGPTGRGGGGGPRPGRSPGGRPRSPSPARPSGRAGASS